AKYFLEFTQNESCGKCVPCRLGTKQMLDILIDITEKKGKMEDVDLLKELAEGIKSGSLCGLGQTVPNPILTTIDFFREEYEAHINGNSCPAHSCKEFIQYKINQEKCQKCMLCLNSCPVGAIIGGKKQIHLIDPEKCIKCGTCLDICSAKFDAMECISKS
ncbi:MAG: NADH-ubiquinone oxidoreductase-F iron-sulfur binding region domain-containing protein, partial [Methanobacterium sp.]